MNLYTINTLNFYWQTSKLLKKFLQSHLNLGKKDLTQGRLFVKIANDKRARGKI